METKLSVNINKIATLRNARGGNIPNVLKVAMDCERFGAQGITVHPRPDERHIRYSDVRELAPNLSTELNIEGNPIKQFVELVTEVRPHQVTLVPDAADVLTSDAGWDVKANSVMLREVIDEFHRHNIRVSLFVDTDIRHIEEAAKVGANRIELYTGPYAEAFGRENQEQVLASYVKAADQAANQFGLDVNAGHDLSQANLLHFVRSVQPVAEVSIGHALISEALYKGLKKTIRSYRKLLSQAHDEAFLHQF